MEVIGYRFGLDRITIVRTDVKGQTAGRQYQWCSQYAPEVLEQPRFIHQGGFPHAVPELR